MFLRKLRVEYHSADAPNPRPCPIGWIDNFAMRNFTNSAVFDDALPVSDGRMEVGLRVPLDALTQAMQDWFRRKGYLQASGLLVIKDENSERKAGDD